MSLPKKGNDFPEKGKLFPDSAYAAAISKSLQENLGSTRRAIKTLTSWTGANDRTVKNWLSGASGPSGEHLALLVRNSDEVLEAFLVLGGRRRLVAGIKIQDARGKLVDALKILGQEED